MQLALLAGVVVGATAPLIGVFIVQKGLSLVGDGLGHVAVAGIGAALLFGTSPTWTAMVVRGRRRHSSSSCSARAGAPPATSRSRSCSTAASRRASCSASRSATNTNLQPYLFGSILTATANDVWTVLALGAVIVVAISFTGRALLAVVLDEDAARVSGIPARALNALLAVLTAVTVVAAMRIVGVLLIAALMVLPVATSRLLARSFRGTLFGAVGRRGGVGGARTLRRPPVGARRGRRHRARRRGAVRARRRSWPEPGGPVPRPTHCSPVPTSVDAWPTS